MMRRWVGISLFLAVLSVLTACQSKTAYAPLVDVINPSKSTVTHYRVQPGDSLYSVAWALNIDFRQLAEMNNLKAPYSVKEGQVLYLYRRSPSHASSHPASRAITTRNNAISRQAISKHSAPAPVMASRSIKPNLPAPRRWVWPVKGKVIHEYSPEKGKKGVDISAPYGKWVQASAAGEVVYSGSGIRGYGNLILIKHNDTYLSAYAFNKDNLVKIGETVKQGQKIAQVGRNDGGVPLLHFEIRKNGNPVDPKRYL